MVTGLMIFIPNMYTLLIARIGQGLCVGMMSGIVPIMVKELTPISLSGSFGGFHNTSYIGGFVVSFGIAFALEPYLNTRQSMPIVFGFTLVTTILQQILLMTIHDN